MELLDKEQYEYEYFVSYSHASKVGAGFGMTAIALEKPIKNLSDVVLLKSIIEEQGSNINNVVILNYIQLEN